MDTKQFSLNNQTGATNPGQQNEVISSSIISQFFVRTMAKDIADIAQKQKAGQSRVSLFVKPIIAQPEPPPPEKPLPKTTAQPQTIPATPSPPTDLPIAKPLPLVTIRPSTPPAPPLPPKQIQPAPGAPPKPIPPVPPLLAQEVKKILDAVPIPIQKTPTPIQKLEERPFLSSIKSVLEKISNKKVLLFASIGILAVLILGLGGWLLSRRGPGPSPSQTPTPSLTQSPSQTPIVSATPTPLAIPSPPFTMEKQEVISLNLDQKFPISTVLQSLAQSQNSGAFTQVAFKTAAQEGEEARLLTLSEFASFFSLTSFSPNIADSTTSPATTTKSAIYLSDLLEQNQYFPFVYYQTQDGSSPFSGGLYPARFGLIAALKNNDKEADIKKILKNLEPTMPEELKDLLIFANGAIEIPESPKFIDNTYKNFDIRYMNFPFSTLTLDYAIVNNYLILTTSKEAMYVVIDRLLTDTTVVKIEQPKDIADWLVYRSEKYEYEIKSR